MMPIDYKKYPKDWKTKIRPDILKRAEDCCEFCGVHNYETGFREEDGNFRIESTINNWELAENYDYKKLIKIILTIAHLDHNINNNKYDNLKALCQRCHLKYDSKFHSHNRKQNRNNKKQQLEIF